MAIGNFMIHTCTIQRTYRGQTDFTGQEVFESDQEAHRQYPCRLEAGASSANQAGTRWQTPQHADTTIGEYLIYLPAYAKIGPTDTITDLRDKRGAQVGAVVGDGRSAIYELVGPVRVSQSLQGGQFLEADLRQTGAGYTKGA
jgi:hypothetical protein